MYCDGFNVVAISNLFDGVCTDLRATFLNTLKMLLSIFQSFSFAFRAIVPPSLGLAHPLVPIIV